MECMSIETVTSKQERLKHKLIEKQNEMDARKRQEVTRILLLGIGDSGKSKLLQQARELYGKGFNKEERIMFKNKVYETILTQFQFLLRAKDTFKVVLSKENEALSQKLLQMCDETVQSQSSSASLVRVPVIDTTLANDLRQLWADEKMQDVWNRRDEYFALVCLEYFMQDEVLDRVSSKVEEYVPSFQDMIHCRSRTTGVTIEKFEMRGAPFELIDVGGQRSERRKWLACFENVTLVIFVTAISEFDESLHEEPNSNKMDEALKVWKDVVNQDGFENVGFLLFLNKIDEFKQKVIKTPFKIGGERNNDFLGAEPMNCPDNSPEQEDAVQNCADYVMNKFLDVVDSSSREGIVHSEFTVATDPDNVSKICDACWEQVETQMLASNGYANFS